MRFGRYEVDGELGRGAMGVVYRAVDPTIGRKVAIKTLRLPDPGSPASADVRKRFQREARAAGMLQHPAIVTVHDVGEDESGAPYIAMELLEGVDLQEILRAGKLSPLQAIDILAQVADGLDYAHGKGIVHRDVKPGNVVLTGGGAVKITDFGIAKLEGGGEQLTQAGHFLGTPSYTAPEQLVGGAVDGRADLFSLAVMAHEMLAGERPFAGESFTTLVYKIVNAPPPAIAGQSPAVSAVLSRAMAKRPEDRYGSAMDFVRELASALGVPLSRSPSGRVIAPAPPAPAPRPGPPRGAPVPPPGAPTPWVVVGLTTFFLTGFIGVAAVLVYTLVAGSPARPRTPAGETVRPAVPRATPPGTPRPTRTTPRPAPSAPQEQEVHLTVNLNVFDAGSGTATLTVDGTDVKSFPFVTRAEPGRPGAKGGGKRGYVRRRLTLAPGSHRLALRVEADGRRVETPTLRVDLAAGAALELKADLQGTRGTLRAELVPDR